MGSHSINITGLVCHLVPGVYCSHAVLICFLSSLLRLGEGVNKCECKERFGMLGKRQGGPIVFSVDMHKTCISRPISKTVGLQYFSGRPSIET